MPGRSGGSVWRRAHGRGRRGLGRRDNGREHWGGSKMGRGLSEEGWQAHRCDGIGEGLRARGCGGGWQWCKPGAGATTKAGVEVGGGELCWPFSDDQLYNSIVLEREAGVCVELARTNAEKAEVDWTKVERVVGMVMGDTKKGKEMRQRTRRWQRCSVAGGGRRTVGRWDQAVSTRLRGRVAAVHAGSKGDDEG